ncbi:putative abhydrolase domain-containing protein 8 [Triplophysa rosa]|uniref:Protein ABHD8 n=1 Tax=Triplophysa rosa TaxID=992332 RepID=A0A9W7WC20_TRIRA|nr:putative abhydrolase domain-containing protein 8 [Triplophysa rosa]
MTSFVDGIFCCFTGKSTNVVVPIESSEPTDGFEIVEVKPGRILRVRHIIPDRPVVEEPGTGEGGSVSCKHKISVYRNGQLLIKNVNEATHPEWVRYQNGDSTVDTDTTENDAPATVQNTEPTPGSATGQPPDIKPAPQQEQQPPQRRRRKPKRSIVIDCERKISCCKGTHPDVALFFIHGVGGSLDIWGSQLDYFSQLGYEVIAPDLVGHGASSAPQIPAAYTFYALAEDVRILFKRYAKRRNILVGHSYGVSFCTFLAHEYPEQVHKVVMMNGGGPTALEPGLCSVFNLPTCVLNLLSPCLTWSFLMAGFAHQGAREKKLLKEKNAFNVSYFVLRSMMSGQYWPEGDEVYHAELTVPVLLVHGMYDKFVPVQEDQRMAEILLLGFLKVIDDGSHMVMMECPDTVNTLLHEFFLWQPATISKPKQEVAATKTITKPQEDAPRPKTAPKSPSKSQPDLIRPTTSPKSSGTVRETSADSKSKCKNELIHQYKLYSFKS